MTNTINGKTKIAAAAIALLFSLALIPLSGGTENQLLNQSQTDPQNAPASDAQMNDNLVYVCACLKTKSCPCMTEAKTEGPCACGTAGGPPLKPVPKNSAWAKTNRKALGQ
jgi:hypothetical protein